MGGALLIPGLVQERDGPIEESFVAFGTPEPGGVGGVIQPGGDTGRAALGQPETDGVGGGVPGLIVREPAVGGGVAVFQNGP